MIPILLMVIGGIMIVISIIGFLLFLFQPLFEEYQVVIKRKDDYAHYTSPIGQRYLQSRINRYLKHIGVLFVLGCILFFTGLYMRFGSRSLDILLPGAEQSFTTGDEAIDSELAEGFDSRGNYVSGDGKVYPYYIIVKGNDIYFKDELLGGPENLSSCFEEMDKENTVYIIDGYAAANTYKEVKSILSENGYEYESDE